MASPYKLYGGALREDAISGLQSEFAQALDALYAAAPPEVQAELGLTSAFRDVGTQRRLWEEAVAKYGSPEAARKWVAEPGKSKHNQGLAADLFGFGLRGGNVSDATKQWVHANAGQFGLGFPMAHEPWHIQLMKQQVDQQMAAAGYTPEQRRNAIASIESAGSGDYAAVGPEADPAGHRARGRYQIMDYNIAPWAEQYLKQKGVTVEQFMADPKLQDALFDAVYGDYVAKYGERGAASKWFTGSEKEPTEGSDVLGKLTGKSYADKYMAALAKAQGTAGHPPNPTVGTGGYVKPGADTTPVKGKDKPKGWKDRLKGFADAIGEMDFGANVSPASAPVPQAQAAANTTAQVPTASAEQQAAQEAQRTRLALAMQRLNQGVLF